MGNKKGLYVNFSLAEHQSLNEMAQVRGETRTAVVRHAVRMLATMQGHVDNGGRIVVVSPEGDEISVTTNTLPQPQLQQPQLHLQAKEA